MKAYTTDANAANNMALTERGVLVNGIPFSYSEGPRFKIRPESGYPHWGYSWLSSLPVGK
jgi:hypothetical protein